MTQTWRELRRFDTRHEAETACTRLAQAGIVAVVPEAAVMGRQPSCRPAADAARLLVAADEFERALAVIAG